MRKRTALVMVAVCMALSAGPAAAGEATVPVTRVTAFSSGVAYFEHNGKVTDNADVLLKFKTEQINDILKSLVVFDFGKGNVTGVSYGSRDPLSRALKSFGVDISGEPTLAALLKQVRGAEAVVSTPEPVKGKVLGVETKTEHIVKSNTIIRRHVLNLVTSDGIKAISLDSISVTRSTLRFTSSIFSFSIMSRSPPCLPKPLDRHSFSVGGWRRQVVLPEFFEHHITQVIQ